MHDNSPTQYTAHASSGGFALPLGARALIPTGMIFDIPSGWAVHIYSRSGIALKQGLMLANSVGIIDSDYVAPVFVMVFNPSDRRNININDGDRICQGQMVKLPKYVLVEGEKPAQKTDRDGGFGSTGAK